MEKKNSLLVTYVLIGINIVLYIICAFTGDLLYNKGALVSSEMMGLRHWYCLLTSVFLHADLMHITGNMIMLYLAGDVMERVCGHKVFLALYLASGLGGSVVSLGYDWMFQIESVSVGASGAVFGIVGALLYLTVFSHGNYRGITTARVVFMIIYMLYLGFRTPRINNAAHIGGMLCGFFMLCLYTKWKMHLERGIYEN